MDKGGNIFQDLFEDSSDGIIIFNDNCTCIVYANSQFKNWFGKDDILLQDAFIQSVISNFNNNKLEFSISFPNASLNFEAYGSLGKIELDNKTQVVFRLKNKTQHTSIQNHLVKLSMMVEQNPATVITFNTNKEIEYVNSKFEESTRLSKEHIVGEKLNEIGTFININLDEILSEVNKLGEWSGEIMISYSDKLIVEKATVKAIINNSGEIESYLKVAEDVTDLRDTEQRLSLFLKNIDEVIYTVSYSKDRKRSITFISPQIENFIGLAPNEIDFDNFNPSDFYHPDDVKHVKSFVKTLNTILEPGRCQYRSYNVKTKEYKWTEITLYPQVNSKGDHTETFGIMRDISSQIQAEELLRHSELKHRMLFNKANDAILIIQDLKVVDCNEKTLNMFNADGFNQIVGQPLYQLMPEKQRNGEDSILNYHYFITSALEGKSQFFQWQHSRLGGASFMTEVSLSGFTLNESDFIQIIVRDITLREKAEEEKNKSIISYFEIFNSSSDLIFILDEKGKILDLNEAVIEKYGNTKNDLTNINIVDLSKDDETKNDILNHIEKAFKKDYKKFDWWSQNAVNSFPVEMVMRPGSYFGKDVIIASGRDISERIKYQTSIKESEQRFKLLSEATFEGIIISKNAVILDVNDRFLELYGYKKRSDIIGKSIYDLSDPEHHDIIQERLEEEKNEPHEFVNYKQDGSKFIIESRAENIPYNVSDIRVHVINDITLRKIAEQEKIRAELAENTTEILKKEIDERKEAERQLFAAQQYSRSIIDSSIDMIISCDKEGKLIEFNKAANKGFGLEGNEFENYSIFDLFKSEADAKLILEQIILRDLFSGEVTVKNKNGETFDIFLSAGKLKNSEGKTMGTMAVARDITDVKETEGKLRENIRQKEVLIKEVHHRVKNNLQVISSILNLQSSYVDDQQTLTILQECQDRIKSMAFIHESLYQSDDLAKVEFTEYLQNLCNNLLFSYISRERTVKIDFDLEPTFLTLDTAIPCGLIVNELVSNSLKYAFKGKSNGIINVSLKKNGNRKLLEVKDNGNGLPKDIDYRNTESLGLQLVVTLIEQIDGVIEYKNENGANFNIDFARD